MREITDIVTEFGRNPGDPFALATIVQTKGSSYRRPGARMLISSNGKTVGSLSGGCLEEEVTAKAFEVLKTGKAELMSFDTRRRFGCNGSLEILVERAEYNFLAELFENFGARRTYYIATSLSGETPSRIVHEEENISKRELFQKVEPSPQLLVIGDGPDSVSLKSFADTLGWHLRTFENASQLGESYDPWTAALVKTHNYGRDFAALRALLPMNLPYVGLIGPRARREQLLGDLLDTGLSSFTNLYAPAGLDLGGETPEAIALSIIAEIQTVFSGGNRQPLRERKTPIHTPQPAKEPVLL